MEDNGFYEGKLKSFIGEKGIAAEVLSFSQSCHSVSEAALAVNARAEDFAKSICMLDSQGNLVVAIVKGEDRASAKYLALALGIERPRIASPEQIFEKTGYPCGGTPPFGYGARFVVDEKVMEKGFVYAGGGSENALVKAAPAEILKANGGMVARVRK
ncbi:MAG: YbaK/EbsC family protein [Candidatus Micrarchaeia archaeon]